MNREINWEIPRQLIAKRLRPYSILTAWLTPDMPRPESQEITNKIAQVRENKAELEQLLKQINANN